MPATLQKSNEHIPAKKGYKNHKGFSFILFQSIPVSHDQQLGLSADKQHEFLGSYHERLFQRYQREMHGIWP